MIKSKNYYLGRILLICVFSFLVLGQGKLSKVAAQEQDEQAVAKNITLDFKDADIQNVLKIISFKAGVNIVTTPEVMGTITIRLVDVPWEKALDVILKTHGYGYDHIGNIITVAPIEKLTEQKLKEVELAQVQPTISEVFNLKYLDAKDAKNAIEPQLSPRGKVTILEMSGQAGWEFGTAELAKRKRLTEEKMGRSKVLIVTDIPPVLDKIKEVIAQIDIKPKQILIETRLMEVNTDRLKDIGIDWGTGSSGVTTLEHLAAGKNSVGTATSSVGGQALGTSGISPSVFGAKATGLTPGAAGLELIYRKLSGSQFEVVLTALEEDVDTNTLSAPSILALNNQEATILVGTKYPILKTEESTQSQYTVSKTLDYYQDIGVQLNVVPQISGNDYINMIIHPAVSSTSSGVGTTNTTFYPIIDIREAETRVLIKDGETIVIGGLLKDVKGKSRIGIPILSKIPFIGGFFRRDTTDVQKIDLLIFITARIMHDGDFSAERVNELGERVGMVEGEAVIPIDRKKRKQ